MRQYCRYRSILTISNPGQGHPLLDPAPWSFLTLSTLSNPSYSTIMASINDPDEGGSIVSQDTITTTTSFALDDHVREPTPTEPRYKGKNKLFYCLHCSWSGQSTTNTRQHLLRKHNIILERSYRSSKLTLNQATDLEIDTLRKVLDKSTINSALLSLIILHNLPFRLVESDAFHTFCKTLNPEATNLILSHSTLRLQVTKSFAIHKDIVRKKLQSAISAIHLSLDVWTSPN
jgi:hypothetical protein